jgi:hypothetical protein
LSIKYEAGVAPEPVWTFRRGEKWISLAGNRNMIARLHSTWLRHLPTTLSRLQRPFCMLNSIAVTKNS